MNGVDLAISSLVRLRWFLLPCRHNSCLTWCRVHADFYRVLISFSVSFFLLGSFFSALVQMGTWGSSSGAPWCRAISVYVRLVCSTALSPLVRRERCVCVEAELDLAGATSILVLS